MLICTSALMKIRMDAIRKMVKKMPGPTSYLFRRLSMMMLVVPQLPQKVAVNTVIESPLSVTMLLFMTTMVPVANNPASNVNVFTLMPAMENSSVVNQVDIVANPSVESGMMFN